MLLTVVRQRNIPQSSTDPTSNQQQFQEIEMDVIDNRNEMVQLDESRSQQEEEIDTEPSNQANVHIVMVHEVQPPLRQPPVLE